MRSRKKRKERKQKVDFDITKRGKSFAWINRCCVNRAAAPISIWFCAQVNNKIFDRSLKIYGFMLLIAGTLKHGKGFRATTRGSIELRKVYANATALGGCPNRAGESLCHDNARSTFFVICRLHTYHVDSVAKLSGSYISFEFLIIICYLILIIIFSI